MEELDYRVPSPLTLGADDSYCRPLLALIPAQPGPKAQDLRLCSHSDRDPGGLGGLRHHRYGLLSPQHQHQIILLNAYELSN